MYNIHKICKIYNNYNIYIYTIHTVYNMHSIYNIYNIYNIYMYSFKIIEDHWFPPIPDFYRLYELQFLAPPWAPNRSQDGQDG